jgi:hypothetical protein
LLFELLLLLLPLSQPYGVGVFVGVGVLVESAWRTVISIDLHGTVEST